VYWGEEEESNRGILNTMYVITSRRALPRGKEKLVRTKRKNLYGVEKKVATFRRVAKGGSE